MRSGFGRSRGAFGRGWRCRFREAGARTGRAIRPEAGPSSSTEPVAAAASGGVPSVEQRELLSAHKKGPVKGAWGLIDWSHDDVVSRSEKLVIGQLVEVTGGLDPVDGGEETVGLVVEVDGVALERAGGFGVRFHGVFYCRCAGVVAALFAAIGESGRRDGLLFSLARLARLDETPEHVTP